MQKNICDLHHCTQHIISTAVRKGNNEVEMSLRCLTVISVDRCRVVPGGTGTMQRGKPSDRPDRGAIDRRLSFRGGNQRQG